MRRILAWLGVLVGAVLARGLDAAWVAFWYAGNRDLSFPVQVVLDAIWLALAGLIAGRIALWIAGSSARGVGLWVAIWVLATTVVDLLIGLANDPWWHEVVTALVMAPAAAIAGGARLPRRRPAPVPPPPAGVDVRADV
jgi:hypothetical protein